MTILISYNYVDPLWISTDPYPYPRGVQEGGNIQVCLKTNRVVVTVHIHVETSHATGSTPAIGKTDM